MEYKEPEIVTQYSGMSFSDKENCILKLEEDYCSSEPLVQKFSVSGIVTYDPTRSLYLIPVELK